MKSSKKSGSRPNSSTNWFSHSEGEPPCMISASIVLKKPITRLTASAWLKPSRDIKTFTVSFITTIMTESGSIASFFFQLSEDSCKALSINDLRGPGPRKSLTVKYLRLSEKTTKKMTPKLIDVKILCIYTFCIWLLPICNICICNLYILFWIALYKYEWYKQCY